MIQGVKFTVNTLIYQIFKHLFLFNVVIVEKFSHRFNLNDSITYYIDAGMPRDKIVVGLATFGHAWILERDDVNGLYCPTVNGTPPAPYTQQVGFLEYYEIMQAFNNETLPWLPGPVN